MSPKSSLLQVAVLIGFFGLSAISAAQEITETDKLMDAENFPDAITRLIELNRKTASQKFPSLVGKQAREFVSTPPAPTASGIKSRALFERGFYAYLNNESQSALKHWTDSIQLLSGSENPNVSFDLRRTGTTLFVSALEHSIPSIEAYNLSLKATAEQIDELTLAPRTDVFVGQLKTEYEIYATSKVLASIFSGNPTDNNSALWEDLMARRKTTELIAMPGKDSIYLRAYESVFDGVFYSANNRARFQKSLLQLSKTSAYIAGPERYSQGLARLVMLQSLFFESDTLFELLNDQMRETPDFRWTEFSSELVSMLAYLRTQETPEFQARLLKTTLPVLGHLILTPAEAMLLSRALVENGQAKAGEMLCRTLISKFPDEISQSKLRALQSVALAKQGRFNATIYSSSSVVREHLTIDEYTTMLYYKSLAHAQTGDYQTSIAEREALLKASPHHKLAPDAQMGLALQYLNLGQKDSARNALRDYLAKYPEGDAASLAKQFLAGL